MEELEEIDKFTPTHKTRVTNKDSTEDITVMNNLTETFKNQMNELQEAEIDAQEVTTEKELAERLSKVYMLNDDESVDVENENGESDTTKQAKSKSKPAGIANDYAECTTRTSECRDTKTKNTSKNVETQSVNLKNSESTEILQNKTDRLMQLLDKREALQAELKVHKEKV